MRHHDGLRDIAGKIKSKCLELINRFKRLPTLRKLALILGRLVQAVGIVWVSKGSRGVFGELKVVRALNEEAYKEWAKQKEDFDKYADYSGMSDEDRINLSPVPSEPSYVEGKYYDNAMKFLRGLIAVFVGTMTTELAKGNRVGDSMSTKRRLHKDSISDLSSRIKTKFMEYIDYLEGDKYAEPIVKMLLNVIRLAQDVSSPTDPSEYAKNIKRIYTAKKDLALSFNPEKLVGDGNGCRLAWLKAGRKIILGLTEALSGYVADSIISKKLGQIESFEAYGREM